VFMLLILLSFIGGRFDILGVLISQPANTIFRILIGR